MAVIINDVEVIVDQGSGSSSDVGPEQSQQPAPKLAPYDIESIIRHQSERALRLEAH